MIKGRIIGDDNEIRLSFLCKSHYAHMANLGEHGWRRAVLTNHRKAEKNDDGTTDEDKLTCKVCKEIGDRLTVEEVCRQCTERITARENYRVRITIKDVRFYIDAVLGDDASKLISDSEIEKAIHNRKHNDKAVNISKRICVHYLQTSAPQFWLSRFEQMEAKQ